MFGLGLLSNLLIEHFGNLDEFFPLSKKKLEISFQLCSFSPVLKVMHRVFLPTLMGMSSTLPALPSLVDLPRLPKQKLAMYGKLSSYVQVLATQG